MPAIAAIAFLPDVTGAVLLFIRHQLPDPALDTARLVRPGESFPGLSFVQLAAADAGCIIPDGKNGGRIEARSIDGRWSDRRR